jgi:hypothetical protein
VDFDDFRLLNVGAPEANADAVNRLYADTQHKTGALVWVDAVNGSDTTGTRGRSDLPFITLTAAKTAASSGDTIVVLPGTYTPSATLLKNGVNWHFLNGAVVNSTSADIFSDGGSAVTANITGHGQFSASNFDIFALSHSSSLVRFSGLTLAATGTGMIADMVTGTLRVEAMVHTSGGIGYGVAGGTLDVRGDSLATTGKSINQTDGTITARFDTLASSGDTCVRCDNGTLHVFARRITGGGGYGVHCVEDGTAFINIHQAIIESTLATASGIAVYLDGCDNLRLRNCILISNLSGTPATVSIDAASASSDVRFFGCFANLAKGANITNLLAAGNLEVDTDVS